jgi:hypothetical protein
MRSATRLLYVLLAIASSTIAEEAQLTLHSTVSGSQEQPRVMYIVPWQQPAAAEFDYELQNTIAAELFSQVDRYEFKRAMAYRDLLNERAVDEAAKEAPVDNERTTDQ